MIYQMLHAAPAVYLDDIPSVVDESIAPNKQSHVLSVCEVEKGFAYLGGAHS